MLVYANGTDCTVSSTDNCIEDVVVKNGTYVSIDIAPGRCEYGTTRIAVVSDGESQFGYTFYLPEKSDEQKDWNSTAELDI